MRFLITRFVNLWIISLLTLSMETHRLHALPQVAIPDEITQITESAIMISAGWHHTCAVTSAGAAKCWGDNDFGQLGDGEVFKDSRKPVNVVGLSSGVVAIAAAYYHTCALTNTGGIKCWGSNNWGQLGNGSAIFRFPTPVDVVGLNSGVIAIDTKWDHTCALTAAGGVKCWGHNHHGQLGDGTNFYRRTPVDVIGLTSGVVAIAVGQWHTCALTNSGAVKCWGMNGSGQVGDGTIDTIRRTPVDVAGLNSGVNTIAAGYLYNCAGLTIGGSKCWGFNIRGQLGDGTQSSKATPVSVAGLTNGVNSMSASEGHTCAIMSSGGVKCWGGNNAGQLGDGTDTNRSTPVDVAGLSNGVIVVAAGDVHTCAVTSTGAAKCWGNNTFGQLGAEASPPRNFTPLNVTGLNGVNISATTTITGTVGSSFVFSATGFISNTTNTIYLNKIETGLIAAAITPIGDVTSDNDGNFVFTLVTSQQTPLGTYTVSVGNAQNLFTLDSTSGLQQPTHQGTVLQIPDKLNDQEIFLPLVRRQ